jgi:hypothetical protein
MDVGWYQRAGICVDGNRRWICCCKPSSCCLLKYKQLFAFNDRLFFQLFHNSFFCEQEN